MSVRELRCGGNKGRRCASAHTRAKHARVAWTCGVWGGDTARNTMSAGKRENKTTGGRETRYRDACPVEIWIRDHVGDK